MTTPRTLIYDIEVAPCLGWFWRTGKTIIGANQIIRPGKIICISYRFTDWEEGRVKSLSWKPKNRKNRFSYRFSDKDLVIKFAKIAEKADIIVGHNGDSFDKKYVNARLAYYEQPTLKHLITEDTLKQSRQQFNLPSQRLDFLCKYFNLPGKLSTTVGLWERVVFYEDKESLEQMISYCEQDVLILDSLYKRLFPYVKHKINRGVFNQTAHACPDCGGVDVQKRGFSYTRSGKYQRFQCTSCGNWFRDGNNLSAVSGKMLGR